MPLDIEELETLGLTPEQIVAVLKIEQREREAQREVWREQKRAQRANVQRTSTGRPADMKNTNEINGHVQRQSAAILPSFFLTERPPKKRESIAAGKKSMPAEWEPKASHYVLARELHRWGRADVLDQADRFRDISMAKDYRYKDSDRAFNTSIRDRWGYK